MGGGRGVPSVKVASTFQPSSQAPLSLIEERGRKKGRFVPSVNYLTELIKYGAPFSPVKCGALQQRPSTIINVHSSRPEEQHQSENPVCALIFLLRVNMLLLSQYG